MKRRIGFSVFLRPGGTIYQAQWANPVTGKPVKRTTKTTIYAQAIQWAAKRYNEAWRQKNLGEPAKLTVGELVDWCWDTHWSQTPYNRLHGAMAKKAKFHIIAAFLEHFKNTPSAELTIQMLRDYRRKREREVKHSTTNREFVCMDFVFSRAVEEEILTRNPFDQVKRVSERSLRRDRSATPEERELILNQDPTMLVKAGWFALFTGLRQGEILNLKVTDLDFVNMEMKVDTWKGGDLRRRFVGIFPETLTLLKSMDLSKEYVFTGPTGQKIPRYGMLHSGWSRLMDKLQISNLTFHDLRHTFATKHWREHHDVVELMNILGHEKVETTMVYINIKRTDLVKRPNSWIIIGAPENQDSRNNPKTVDNQESAVSSVG